MESKFLKSLEFFHATHTTHKQSGLSRSMFVCSSLYRKKLLISKYSFSFSWRARSWRRISRDLGFPKTSCQNKSERLNKWDHLSFQRAGICDEEREKVTRALFNHNASVDHSHKTSICNANLYYRPCFPKKPLFVEVGLVTPSQRLPPSLRSSAFGGSSP